MEFILNKRTDTKSDVDLLFTLHSMFNHVINDYFLLHTDPLSINLSLIVETKHIFDMLRWRARVHFFDLAYTDSILGD